MTLTEAAFWTKRFGVIAGIAFLVFVIVIIVLTIKSEDTMLPQYLTANYACTDKGSDFLTNRLSIPSLKLSDDSDMYFELKTDSGKVDALPEIINVYAFDNPTQSISSQADAKVLASKLGFDADTVIRKGTESYVWVDKTTHKTLEVFAKNLNFNLTSDPDYVRETAQTYTLPTEQEAKSLASNALRSLGFSSEDYSDGTPTTTLIDVNPDGSFSEASSLSEAELIRVDFHRSKSMITIPSNVVGADSMVAQLTSKLSDPVIETPVVNDEKITVYSFNTAVTFLTPSKSDISVYIGPKDDETENTKLESIYQIDYIYWPIDESSCGTYELITPETALEKVQSGEGSLVYLNDVGGDDVVGYTQRTVKKFTVLYINLTYYESPTEQNFLQPVYVISGEAIFSNDTKGEFDFYYPAINYDNVVDKIELPAVETTEKDSTSLL